MHLILIASPNMLYTRDQYVCIKKFELSVHIKSKQFTNTWLISETS